jgi:drug/metabolite transporter (DMT)-like permease
MPAEGSKPQNAVTTGAPDPLSRPEAPVSSTGSGNGATPNRAPRSWWRKLDWRVALALAATYIFFGSGPAGARAALASLPPLGLVAVRGLVAGTFLLVWAIKSGAQPPSRRQWLSAVAIGILILALGAGSGFAGQRTIPSGVAGVLSGLLPLFAACLGYVLFRETLPRRGVFGLVVGFIGVGFLLRPGSGLDPFGLGLIVASQVFWALGAVLAPHFRLPGDPRVAAGVELLGGSGVLLLAALVLRDFEGLELGAVSWQSWLGFGWLILSAVVGFTAYGFLAKTVSPSVATTFSYVNPVVAMFLGWLIFAEPLSMRMLLATAVIVAGVCFIVSTRAEAPARLSHPLTSGHGHVFVIRGSARPVPVRPKRDA